MECTVIITNARHMCGGLEREPRAFPGSPHDVERLSARAIRTACTIGNLDLVEYSERLLA